MVTPYQERVLPAPTIYPDNQVFWEACNRRELWLAVCAACGPFWYPRPHCPHCGKERSGWQAASGRGTVYALSITRRAGPIAYAIAYVTLDEGITILSNLVDCDLDAVAIGDRVEVVFKPSGGGPLIPMFRPPIG